MRLFYRAYQPEARCASSKGICCNTEGANNINDDDRTVCLRCLQRSYAANFHRNLAPVVTGLSHEYFDQASNDETGIGSFRMILKNHNQTKLCVWAVTSSELTKSGIKIISGTASRARHKSITKAGRMIRHAPESRRFSVFAVP